MNRTEWQATLSLSSIFIIRMMGLFMILPVFALYADKLKGITPLQLGLALGIYGLSQALLQIPFGMLSDRYGRKPLMIIGLGIFALGSFIAGATNHIAWIILGRALQGAGAIGSVIQATLADLTTPQHRTQAMAIMGIGIGLSFMVGIALGPILYQWIDVPGIFRLTGIMGIITIAIAAYWVPAPTSQTNPTNFNKLLRSTLRDPVLWQLNIAIFGLHIILTAAFVALPMALVSQYHLPENQHWQLYLGVLLASIVIMAPFARIVDKYAAKPTLVSAFFILAASLWSLALFHHQTITSIALHLVVFFAAFNLLEAVLPSLVSKHSPSHSKGTAIGIFSSIQFLGIFTGGSLGGILYGHDRLPGVLLFTSVVATSLSLLFAALTTGPLSKKP